VETAGGQGLSVRGYERIAREIAEFGVRDVFGLIGRDTMRIAALLPQHGVRYVSARHEVGAVSMAVGYSRSCSQLGVALVSRGAGLTNALSGMIAGAKAKAPLLVILGETSDLPRAAADAKYVDQSSMLAAAGVRVVRPERAQELTPALRTAMAGAKQGLTTAFLVPLDVLHGQVPSEPRGEPGLEGAVALGEAQSSLAAVGAAADLIEHRGRTGAALILAGRGAVDADALDALVQLGDVMGAMLGTSLMAKGFFGDRPWSLGVVGALLDEAGRSLLSRADLILSFGASLDPFTTDWGDLLTGADVIQIDSSPNAVRRDVNPAVFICADAGVAARELLAELKRRDFHADGFRRLSFERWKTESPALGAGEASGLDPYALIRELDRLLPPDRVVVVDAGHQLTFAAGGLSVSSPHDFICPIEFQCVGLGLGTATGAAIGRPDRLVVASIGDGAFMMSLGELDTAVRYGLRLLVLVMNDGAFGAELQYLRMLELPTECAAFHNPSFADVAMALGADGVKVSSLEDLNALTARLKAITRPLVLDCRIDSQIRARWIERNLGTERLPRSPTTRGASDD
jgi:acetolactate synthase-1/2/3 large subunit